MSDPSISRRGDDQEVAAQARRGPAVSDSSGPRSATTAEPVAPTRTMVLIGDEYAAGWAEAMRVFAASHGYRLEVMTRSGCPVADGGSFGDPGCVGWRLARLASIDSLRPDLVVAAQADQPTGATTSDALWAAQTSATIGRLRGAATQVVLLQADPESARGQATAAAVHTSRVSTVDPATLRPALSGLAAP